MAYPQHSPDDHDQSAQTAMQTWINVLRGHPGQCALQSFRRTSQLAGPERGRVLADIVGLDAEESGALDAGLSADQADTMIENVVGRYALRPRGRG